MLAVSGYPLQDDINMYIAAYSRPISWVVVLTESVWLRVGADVRVLPASLDIGFGD